ncbi:MAG: hypothetical protein JWN15_1697 [Firmicutes bacterium]|nr:hypothetical protein [Bacillota bacterium]
MVGDSLVDLRMAQAAGALAVAVPEYADDVDLLSAHADILLSGARSVLSTTQLRPGQFWRLLASKRGSEKPNAI